MGTFAQLAVAIPASQDRRDSDTSCGSSGEIRGTSKREDAAFWIIALDDAKKQADDKRGARFISRFTKPSRNTQDEIPCFEWHVVTDQVTGEVSVGCKPAQTMACSSD